MGRLTSLCVLIVLSFSLDLKPAVARMGRCQRLCSENGAKLARICIEKYCTNYLRDRIPTFGKRASTTIVGVKTESEGATIDINVQTKDIPKYGINKTTWEGLIYLTMLHLDDKKMTPTDRRRRHP